MKKPEYYVEEMSRELAKAQAEELEAKGGLVEEKERFIERTSLSLASSMKEKLADLTKQMEEVSKILAHELSLVDKNKKDAVEADFKKIIDGIEKVEDPSSLVGEKSLKEQFGVHDETLRWIYSIGFNLFQEQSWKQATSIFVLLTLLHPTVRDFWMALGLSLGKQKLTDEALQAFTFVSTLDPKHAPSRYESAKLYLHKKEAKEALEEIHILEKIIQEKNLQEFRPECEKLKAAALNERKSA